MIYKTISARCNHCVVKKSSFEERILDASIAITARWKVTCISKVGEQHVFTRNIGCHVNGFPDFLRTENPAIPFVTFMAFRSPPSSGFERNCLQSLEILQTGTRVCVHFSITFRGKSFLHSFMLAAAITPCVYLAVKYSYFLNQSVRTISLV